MRGCSETDFYRGSKTILTAQQDRLVTMRINDEIDTELFGRKPLELRDREAMLKLRMEALDRSHHEQADLAAQVFELSQTLTEKWLTADYIAKRRILETVCLNLCLDDANLVPEIRKPFDVLAEGHLVQSSRGDRTPIELFLAGLADWGIDESGWPIQ
jgi:hypothetical protein